MNNLQAIQKRVEELSAELLTLSNDLSAILSGEISRSTPVALDTTAWADDIKYGDVVECVGFTENAAAVRLRCFTVGKTYIAEYKMKTAYGIRVLRDDEGEGHDATNVIFRKVFA